jgi:hypothetical protein
MGDIINNYFMGKDSHDEPEIFDGGGGGPEFPVQRAVLAIILVIILYMGYNYAKEHRLLETVPATRERVVNESKLLQTKKLRVRQPLDDLSRQNAEIEKERKRFYGER